MPQQVHLDLLLRIAEALERLGAPAPAAADFSRAEAFVWRAAARDFTPVAKVNRVGLELLEGIDRARDLLLANTRRFSRGLPANNALLWGARGMGKSSLVKAAHGAFSGEGRLKLIEIHREDIESLPDLLLMLREKKTVSVHRVLRRSVVRWPGGQLQIPKNRAGGRRRGAAFNVLFYATSNRRHLVPRDMMENERATAIDPGEVIEEKVSLSDRFGLWLGFHNCGQDDYLAMVFGYVRHFGLDAPQRTFARRRWSGRSPAAPVPDASPGSSFRIWRAGWARG